MSRGDDRPVAWVHPSVRDVVVDQLAKSPVERRRFLRGCGSRGVELALSRAGGAQGERFRPLLQDNHDWEAIAGRVADLLRDPGFTAVRDVLNALETTLEADDGSAPQRVAGSALDAVLDRWRAAVGPTALADLTAYYGLTVRVSPLRPGPPLEATWRDAVDRLDEDRPLDLADLTRLFDLVETLRVNEPRFLRLNDPGPLLLRTLARWRTVLEDLADEATEMLDTVDDDADLGYDEMSGHHAHMWSWRARLDSSALTASPTRDHSEAMVELVVAIHDALDEPYERLGRWIEEEEQRLAESASELDYDESDDDEEPPSFEELVKAMFEDL